MVWVTVHGLLSCIVHSGKTANRDGQQAVNGEVSAHNRAELALISRALVDWLIIREPKRLHLSHLLAKVAGSIEIM